MYFVLFFGALNVDGFYCQDFWLICGGIGNVEKLKTVAFEAKIMCENVL